MVTKNVVTLAVALRPSTTRTGYLPSGPELLKIKDNPVLLPAMALKSPIPRKLSATGRSRKLALREDAIIGGAARQSIAVGMVGPAVQTPLSNQPTPLAWVTESTIPDSLAVGIVQSSRSAHQLASP